MPTAPTAETEVIETDPPVEEVETVEVAADEGTVETKVEAAKPADLYSLVEAEFGDAAITEDIPGVTDAFDADRLKALDPTARVALRVMMAKIKAREAALDEERTKLKAPVEAERAAVEAAKAAHLREVAKFRAMASSPRVRELLSKPIESIDPFTAEGQRELAARQHAEAMRPFVEDARRAEQDAAFAEFQAANPWSKDEALQKRALALVTERNRGLTPAELAAGKGLDPREALRLVHHDDLVKASEKRRAAELKARQESAAKVARATSPGTVAAPTVPAGLKGAKLAAFFESNPDAHRRYRQERGLA